MNPTFMHRHTLKQGTHHSTMSSLSWLIENAQFSEQFEYCTYTCIVLSFVTITNPSTWNMPHVHE